MKALVVTPKDEVEFKFLTGLLTKLRIGSCALSYEDLENTGLTKLMQDVDESEKTGSDFFKKRSDDRGHGY